MSDMNVVPSWMANAANAAIDAAISSSNSSSSANMDGQGLLGNETEPVMIEVDPEEIHQSDADTALALNVTLIGCILLAYHVKANRIYHIPESAAAMIVGIVSGGIARLVVKDLTLFEFSPEIFFFVLLPPIIFEAGYSLNKKQFFENIGAIAVYAVVGTVISTFIVGYATFYAAKIGLIRDIDSTNPMEALLFGALISAVDPVATLSIMGSPELQCDQLLYSLVFGESVLNDAVAIVLFKTFLKYYDPDGPDLGRADIPAALLSFVTVTVLSILVGVGLGLVVSFIYRHTSLSSFPKFETALLFLFCYCCYATAEAVGLSGIMALFFNGMVLSHYNSYNLSKVAHVTSEQIFASLATITETAVFLYMGMNVFTGRFNNWDIMFPILAMSFCVLGRACNIFPLSWIANLSRTKGKDYIPPKMQFVLWFAGLRGAIAFALSENMPGPNKETYVTATLTICLFTTIVCGGFTERILTEMNMKEGRRNDEDDDPEEDDYDGLIIIDSPMARRVAERAREGIKGLCKDVDDRYLKVWFGGEVIVKRNDDHGDYELNLRRGDSDTDEDNSDEVLLEPSSNSVISD
mmetsp:Transcript_11268/g.15048  ORF Transcript_11268/g.15048 Transcript_11268/m.15048 type:complete len:580 (-) Transcript_11268:264-2003(-)